MKPCHALLLALSVPLGGCSAYALSESKVATLTELPPARADVARVCVLRPSLGGQLVTFVVRDNGHLVGATRAGTSFCYFAAPGRHRVIYETESEDIVADYEARAGQRLYLEQILRPLWHEAAWVAEEEAARLLAKTPVASLVRVPVEETLPKGIAPAL